MTRKRGPGRDWLEAECRRRVQLARSGRLGGFIMPESKPAPPRPRIAVHRAAMVGVTWSERRVSKSQYPMDRKFCKDLSYWLNRRVAHVLGPAKANGHGWTSLVCWPGHGVFLAQLATEV